MINKILSTVAILGVIGIIGYEYFQSIDLQTKMESFVSKGPRFTAYDGQELCERVRELERVSYEYQNTHNTILPCNYIIRK